MREAPQWFQDELRRIGGVNPYGEPIFRLSWSPTELMTIGGRFSDGFEGYRQRRAVPGEPCWALMVWEPREFYGSPERWEQDYRDPESNLLDCGGYPKYGRYRLLQKLIHREIVQRFKWQYIMVGKEMRKVPGTDTEFVTYRMEPCGFLLDMMLPMLMSWRKLTDAGKRAALKQEEQLRKDEFLKKVKDARDGCKISRGSQLVQKRAELIEKGMKQAMAIAAQTGLGMRIG